MSSIASEATPCCCQTRRRSASISGVVVGLTTLTILLCVLRDLSPAIAQDAHGFVCEVGNALKRTQDRFRLTLRERDAAFFRDT
ncbi:MAG: hypothetical protein ACK5V0_09265, partial [Alphaproteobacteria bacterium]